MKPSSLLLCGFALASWVGCTGEIMPFVSADASSDAGGASPAKQRASAAPTCVWPTPPSADVPPEPIGTCQVTANGFSTGSGVDQDGQPCTVGGVHTDGCQSCFCNQGGPSLDCAPPICNAGACPSRLPTAQHLACDPEGCSCSYPTACGTSNTATCVGGVFELAYDGCSPRCPEQAPEDGSPCWFSSVRCDYEADGCSIRASCIGSYGEPLLDPQGSSLGGRWVLMDGAVPPGIELCPKQVPQADTPCPKGNERVCIYDNGCFGLIHAACWQGNPNWQVTDLGCAETVCPASRPHTGEACDVPQKSGLPCEYADGSACASRCLCGADRRWTCYDWLCYDDYGPKVRRYIEDALPPGVIPSPFGCGPDGGYCKTVGGTCTTPEMVCTCTAQGWSCAAQ